MRPPSRAAPRQGRYRGRLVSAVFGKSIRYVASPGWRLVNIVGDEIDCDTYSPSTPVWPLLRPNFATKE